MELLHINTFNLFKDNAKELLLTHIVGELSTERMFDEQVLRDAQSVADLVGHLNFIHLRRIQVLGSAEMAYYQRSFEQDQEHWQEFIRIKPPCLIVADDLYCPETLQELCQQHQICLLTSPKPSAAVIDHLRQYLSQMAAPRVMMHGVFMDIFGMGIFITGESGLGKSELGLELITRGHALIADDAIEFICPAGDIVEGSCPPLLENLLEVRGLGLLDIRSIFGETAVRRKMKLRLIVRLIKRNDITFERLPTEPHYQNILGQMIRTVTLQIAAGRNMAVIVEAAVRNTILNLRGIDTLKDFMQKQQAHILWKHDD